MGVRWETQKPSEWLRDEGQELHEVAVPTIGRMLAKRLQTEIRRFTPHGKRVLEPWASWSAFALTDDLIRSIQVDHGAGKLTMGGYRTEISTDKPYAPYVEYGTRPHPIRPKNPGGMLRFHLATGERVFARFVRHPGNRGVHMFVRGVAEIRPRTGTIANPVMDAWAKERHAVLHGLEAISKV